MRRMLFAFAALVACAAFAVPAALANPPTIVNFPDSTDTTTITDLCPSAITLNFSLTKWSLTLFTDNNGVLTEAHAKFFEQDTFVGPTGTTLVGDQYSSETKGLFDRDGNLTNIYGDGPLEKVSLPGGSNFFTAGRVDFLARGENFVFTPDTGHSGNLAGFCAALGAA
jgi:hypothetical protein